MSDLPSGLKLRVGLAALGWCLGAVLVTLMGSAGRVHAAGAAKLALEFLYQARGYEEAHPFNGPLAMAVDAAGEHMYVADTNNNQIVVLSSKTGATLNRFRHWVRDAYGNRIPGEPCGVQPGDRGTVLVSDQLSSSVDVLDGFGESLGSISVDTSALKPGEKASPGRMCRDTAGNLYVVERTTGQVLVFNGAGQMQRRFGGLGRGEGRFEMIADVAVASDGTAYVLQSQGDPVVQAFDATGRWKAGFGHHADRPQDFHLPLALALDDTGRIWVTDTFAHDVRAYTTAGEFLGTFGGRGNGRGWFYFPSDVAVSGDTLYVLEKAGRRLQALRIRRLPVQ